METLQMILKAAFTIFVLAVLAEMAGCAGVNQAYSAAGASALVDARTASDNALKTSVVAVCMTPYDTIVRNSWVVPGVKALCLPGGDQANPSNVLDAVAVNKAAQGILQSATSKP